MSEIREAGFPDSAGFAGGTVPAAGVSPAFSLSAMSFGADVFGPTFGIADVPTADRADPGAVGPAVGRASGAGASAHRDSGGGEAFGSAPELAEAAEALSRLPSSPVTLSPATSSSAGFAVAGVAADAFARVDFPDEVPVFAGLFVLRAKSSPPAAVARDTPGTFDNT